MDSRSISKYYIKEFVDDQAILEYIDDFELNNHRRSLQLILKNEQERDTWYTTTNKICYNCKFRVIDLTDAQWVQSVDRLNKSIESKIVDIEQQIDSYQQVLVNLNNKASIIVKGCNNWIWRIWYYLVDDINDINSNIKYYEDVIARLWQRIDYYKQHANSLQQYIV